MSDQKKRTASDEINGIEDALVESILGTSGNELREEFSAAGLEPDACIKDIEERISSARAECTESRLDEAREALAAWRAGSKKPGAALLEAARDRLQRIRTDDRELDSRMMLAARKGEGLSESDLEGLLEDLVDLERLESGKDNE